MMQIFLNTKLHAFFRSVMLVCGPLTNLKIYNHCWMLMLYEFKIADFFHMKYDITLGKR